MATDPADGAERVVVVAPTVRDFAVAARLFAAEGLACARATDLDDAAGQVEAGIGALVLTDLSFGDPGMRRLLDALDAQPDWSDVPTVVLHRAYDPAASSSSAIERRTNVTVVDRPASMRSFVSAVRASLRGRRWQYRLRDQLEALRRAELALRAADRRKDEFLATLAHELRNPLAPIRTGLRLMRGGTLADAELGPLRDVMERQVLQLVRLIDDLLDVSRIATGKILLKRERIDLREVVARAIEGFAPVFGADDRRLSVELPDAPVTVVGDATRLAQAVANLLSNAAKYTDDGGAIRVALRDDGRDGVIVVEDDGAGIPPEMLDRIFELFAQVDGTLDRARGGLGIGLSLVRSLVALHGGSVVAHSPGIGRGSRFTLRVPRAPAGR